MINGPSLVVRGTLVGSMVLGLLGWFAVGHINLLPEAEVAYAAPPVPTEQHVENIAPEPESFANCEVNLSYPESVLQWCAIITRFANQSELPPNLVAALILQESGGDASAYSASGAVGLMQVMPRDGLAAGFDCINGPCFASRPTIEELQDPSYNVEYGTNMLARLINKLGSLREALKSYGPMDMEYSYADRVLAIYENYR
jgi:soluble lytic murein transglycosylase-like protein